MSGDDEVSFLSADDAQFSEKEDIVSLDDTTVGRNDAEIYPVTETMCRVIGTTQNKTVEVICVKSAASCRRHTQHRLGHSSGSTKRRVPPGNYPAFRDQRGRLVGAVPPDAELDDSLAPLGAGFLGPDMASPPATEMFEDTDGDKKLPSFKSWQENKPIIQDTPRTTNVHPGSLSGDAGWNTKPDVPFATRNSFLARSSPRDYEMDALRQELAGLRTHVDSKPASGTEALLHTLLKELRSNGNPTPGPASVYTVTGVPRPRKFIDLATARSYSAHFDGHVSVFATESEADCFIAGGGASGDAPVGDLFNMVGVDESTGKGRELFLHHISTEAALRDHLTPSGLDSATKSLIADLMLDSLSLPGAMVCTAAEDSFEQLTTAMTTMASNSRADEGGMKDVQWRNAKRTSLAAVKNEEDLYDLLSRLMEDQYEVLQKRTVMISSILANHAGWSEERAKILGKLCLINRVGADTYSYYLFFVMHLLKTSVREGWKSAEVEIKLFLEKTNGYRGNNISRLCALCEIYCCLRDLQRNRWRSLQLFDRRWKTLNAAGGGTQAPGHGACGHCGTTLHPGGKKSCPLKHLSKEATLRKVTEIFSKLLE